MHSHEGQPAYQFDLSGGSLCLDFANTVSRRKVPELSIDHLPGYDDLIAFAQQSQVVLAERANRLRSHSGLHRSAAQDSLRRAVAYRENLYRAFSAVAEGKPAAPDDVQQINDFALEALRHRCLALAEGHYRWEWQWSNKNLLDSILWPIAQSAADLLISPELSIVHMCEAPDCAWLFLDRSRNRNRRWCDMKVCGNRQKARRHYRRRLG